MFQFVVQDLSKPKLMKIMMEFVHFFLTSHPASGWLKKGGSESKKKRRAGRESKSSLTPDSFHSRSSVTKRNNPRHNPAP